MPRKSRDSNKIALVPETEFEQAVEGILSSSKEHVDAEFAEMQASNKLKREKRRDAKADD